MRLRAGDLYDHGPAVGRGSAGPLCRVSLRARHLRRSHDGACVCGTRATRGGCPDSPRRAMSRSLDIGPYEGRSDRPLWLVAAVITAILAGLAIGSANSYVSIVVAQATVSFDATPTLMFQGTESNGSLAPDGSLTISLGIRVDNPSARTLHLQLLAFSEWVEDGLAEAGLNEPRRLADAHVVEANGPVTSSGFSGNLGKSRRTRSL